MQPPFFWVLSIKDPIIYKTLKESEEEIRCLMQLVEIRVGVVFLHCVDIVYEIQSREILDWNAVVAQW